MFDSLTAGQPDGLLVLAAALGWRYRDDWRGAVSIAALIAAKLVVWPLLLWLLVTRRLRSLVTACLATVIFLAGSWALIGFHGLASYPKLLAADARAFETQSDSFSVVKALSVLGISTSASRWLAVVIAAAVAACIVRLARRSDEGLFAAALVFGLLSSPILWLHYLLLLFVPLAIWRRQSLAIWLLVAYGWWVILIALPPGGVRAACTVAVAVALVVSSAVRPGSGMTRVRRDPQPPSPPLVGVDASTLV